MNRPSLPPEVPTRPRSVGGRAWARPALLGLAGGLGLATSLGCATDRRAADAELVLASAAPAGASSRAPRPPSFAAELPLSAAGPATPPADPVSAGREAWWADVAPGPYRLASSNLRPGYWLLAIGRSTDHHHAAEGLLNAKVEARIAVRRLAPDQTDIEPELVDLFITPDRRFFVLYGLPLPSSVAVEAEIPVLTPPDDIASAGPHQVGRHQFYGDRHLFLECDIEGPLTNPDWGSMRVTAQLSLENP